MSTQRLNYCEPNALSCNFCPLALVIICILLLSPCTAAGPQTSPTTEHQGNVPPELQVADPHVKELLDFADKSARLGKYGECFTFLQQALELATKQNFLADRALVEDKLAVYYFTQGKLEEAKSEWLNALSDGMTVSNMVVQADVLVALSALQQSSGHLDQAMKAVNEALELSRKCKSLYIESRVLGELSRLQLLADKQADARSSIEEALQIDRSNRYDWEAGHLLGMAWVSTAESKPDKAIEFATSARDLAVKNDNYLVFIQASLFLGQAYVQIGHMDEGIRTLELARKGLSEQSKPLFRSADGYTAMVSLAYFKVTFLEALAMAYEATNRPADALNNWQDLYDTATAAGFTLARAESARRLADLYRTRKEFTKSIDYYALAAEAYVGNDESRIEALASEASLLFQQGEKDKSLRVDEELLSLARTSKSVRLQFIVDLAIVEILDGTGRVDRVETALTGC